MEIKKVGVLGCGLMGSGIAQVAATAGFDVSVLEVEQKILDKGLPGLKSRWQNLWRRARSRKLHRRSALV